MYDVSTALQEIEEELISSMRRNMSRHTAEQLKEGINWTQWQAEMLVGLKDYERANKKLFPDYFSTIDDKIDEAIRQAYAAGEIKEAQMLDKVLKNHKYNRAQDGATAAFFRLNDKKLNALIAATQKDINTAEWALLRRANDIYRQTIFNTQFKYATGGKTLYQSIDECTKEFLKNGIDCVEYKNGARVNIASYSEMALRTTNKRASLMGAANKRMEYGIHTVLVSSHNTACPMCVQWQGKIYYDDVYGQLSYDEIKHPKYPLLSTAVSGGMFHPNCRNGMNTYYEGVNSEPEPPTEKQKQKMLENYMLEQRQRQCERNVRKFRILENSALDPKDRLEYAMKAGQWQTRLTNLVDAYPDILRLDRERLKTWGLQVTQIKKVLNADPQFLIDAYGADYAKRINKLVQDCKYKSADIWAKYGSRVRVIDTHKSGTAYYSPAEDGIYLDIDSSAKGNYFKTPFNTMFHESGHDIDFMLGKQYYPRSYTISYGYEANKLGKTIKRETEAMIDEIEKRLKEEFKVHGTDTQWLFDHGFISSYDLDYIKRTGNTPTVNYCKQFTYVTFMRTVQKEGVMNYCDISDMFQGATKSRVRCGIGHSESYYKGVQGDFNLATEAFAEMFAAEFTNAGSLEAIKKYLPESYKVFQEILEYVLKGAK